MLRRFFHKAEDNDGTASVTSNNNTSVVSNSDTESHSYVSASKPAPAASEQFMDFFQSSTSPSWSEPITSAPPSPRIVNELKAFDVCIEASDEMASTAMMTGRVDEVTGLNDCSVLVSADGDLLIIPQAQDTRATGNGSEEGSKAGAASGEEVPKRVRMQTLLKQTAEELGREYESAVFLGHDVDPIGDESVNGFSTKGWSVPACSLALHQSADTLEDTADFCEDLILTKKSSAASENQMLHRLRSMVEATGSNGPRYYKYDQYLKDTFPKATVEIVPDRVGPLLANGGSVQTTLVALDHYFTSVAESESQRWRQITSSSGPLAHMRHTKQHTEERIKSREVTLYGMYEKINHAEAELELSKQNAAATWNKVQDTEQKVTEVLQDQMAERSRLREHQHLEQLKRNETERVLEAAKGNLGATSSEIWDIVSEVTASMEEGSFEPMDLPQVSLTASQDGLRELSSHSRDDGTSKDDEDSMSALPKLSRLDLEDEHGLPELRAAAVAADEAVRKSAEKLLTALSDWDKRSRSARLAAETCLVDVGNAEAKFLRSIVKSERESLRERTRLLDELEEALDQVDVQEDLRKYVINDKEHVGGTSSVGDDEDGGISSALQLLHKHLGGDVDGVHETYTDDDEGDGAANDHGLTRESIEDSVELFFSDNKSLADNALADESTSGLREEFENTVHSLCKLGQEKASSARPLRSTICYSLNTKRKSHQKIPSKLQFDSLVRVFVAVLSGCGTDKSSSSLARLLMLMSQSIYYEAEDKTLFYVKDELIGHGVWEKDEFWDHALLECVTESLSHSGVLSHFERHDASSATMKKSEWTEASQLKWHDLKTTERQEAASQVHSVVFLQIGTLAHHMVDLGCGLDRSAAFVRRMCIQHQLPSSQRIMLLQQLVFHWKDTREQDGTPT